MKKITVVIAFMFGVFTTMPQLINAQIPQESSSSEAKECVELAKLIEIVTSNGNSLHDGTVSDLPGIFKSDEFSGFTFKNVKSSHKYMSVPYQYIMTGGPKNILVMYMPNLDQEEFEMYVLNFGLEIFMCGEGLGYEYETVENDNFLLAYAITLRDGTKLNYMLSEVNDSEYDGKKRNLIFMLSKGS